MPARTALVLTSINAPNAAMAALAGGAAAAGFDLIIVGDARSPAGFSLAGARFISLTAQRESGFAVARLCPIDHYARKNVGYLAAMRNGATIIVETDDDNHPSAGFFGERRRRIVAAVAERAGWLNAYRYFSEATIWPRGLPLDAVHDSVPPFETLSRTTIDCPIQQGLADLDPDVDAIYRLLLPLPQTFRADRRVGLGSGAWCPFNSQNTTWWSDAFPLLYLPAHCSIRMTDIWRSFVAQRIAWENGWHVLFHEPTVRQERNAHDLMLDFAAEVPGYLHNRRIQQALDGLALAPGSARMADNLRRCYEALVGLGVVGRDELPLLEAWLLDLSALAPAAAPSGGDPARCD